jgi:ABC-type transport system involved in cytochrome bd biosynthesis fused ATPase/permease subunit
MAALGPFIAGRTTLVITHRAAVAAAMDRTVRLVGGRIVEVAQAVAAKAPVPAG